MLLRPATPDDEPFLTEMLGHAASAPTPQAIADYTAGFGRPGDFGVIADGCGAAWCRRIRAWGFVADDVPELTIGLAPEARGQGLGRLLLEALIDEAARRGERAISLSVDPANAAALSLYAKLGFEQVGVNDGHPTMLRVIPAPPPARA